MIIRPERFADGKDGPCHPPEMRNRFWTDVCKSLELSYDLLFEQSRRMNKRVSEILPEEYIEDLEERISRIQSAPPHMRSWIGESRLAQECAKLDPAKEQARSEGIWDEKW